MKITKNQNISQIPTLRYTQNFLFLIYSYLHHTHMLISSCHHMHLMWNWMLIISLSILCTSKFSVFFNSFTNIRSGKQEKLWLLCIKHYKWQCTLMYVAFYAIGSQQTSNNGHHLEEGGKEPVSCESIP